MRSGWILAKYSDAFYIGGTKNGAFIGEALVIKNDELKNNFFFYYYRLINYFFV